MKKIFKHKKISAFVILILFGLGAWKFNSKTSATVQFQTATAEVGTLITSISGSGSITSGNSSNLTTKTSGVVSKVYVTNGDRVVKGQKIAEIGLDEYARERQSAAWVDYLSSTEAVKEAINNKAVNDISMWNSRQAVLNAQDAFDNMNDNDTNPVTHAVYTANERMIITKTLDQTRKAFSVYESKYNNSDANIVNAYAKVSASLRDYQENSSTIIAPTNGVISDLSLAPGLVVNASSTTSSTNGSTIVTAQTIGKISEPTSQLIATISLTEIDVTHVKANQKATLTLDAYSDKSFTGKVLAVNTDGRVSSGVTAYPVTILLDPVTVDIYPNMSVTAKIITNIKDSAILVPSGAVQTNSGQTQVRTLVNGKEVLVDAVAGFSNDTQTEIVSGIKEGDTVITGATTTATSTNTSTGATSVFSRIGGTGSFGGAVRIQGR